MARQVRNSQSVLSTAALSSVILPLLLLLLFSDVPSARASCGCCCDDGLGALSALAGLNALARLPGVGVGARLRRSAAGESPQPQRVMLTVDCNCGDDTEGTTLPPVRSRPTRQTSAILPAGYSRSSVEEAGRYDEDAEEHGDPTSESRHHPIHFTPLDPSGGHIDFSAGRQPADNVAVGGRVFSSGRFRREFSARNVFPN